MSFCSTSCFILSSRPLVWLFTHLLLLVYLVCVLPSLAARSSYHMWSIRALCFSFSTWICIYSWFPPLLSATEFICPSWPICCVTSQSLLRRKTAFSDFESCVRVIESLRAVNVIKGSIIHWMSVQNVFLFKLLGYFFILPRSELLFALHSCFSTFYIRLVGPYAETWHLNRKSLLHYLMLNTIFISSLLKYVLICGWQWVDFTV